MLSVYTIITLEILEKLSCDNLWTLLRFPVDLGQNTSYHPSSGRLLLSSYPENNIDIIGLGFVFNDF